VQDKFIRIISPISLPAVLLFDGAVGYYFVVAFKKILEDESVFSALFLIIQIVAVVIAFLTTREVLRHGVKITDKSVEFTALDSNNKVFFDEIERVEVLKDTKASLKKNFVSRYSSLIFYLSDDTVLTVELGITTKKKLALIEQEITSRLVKTEEEAE